MFQPDAAQKIPGIHAFHTIKNIVVVPAKKSGHQVGANSRTDLVAELHAYGGTEGGIHAVDAFRVKGGIPAILGPIDVITIGAILGIEDHVAGAIFAGKNMRLDMGQLGFELAHFLPQEAQFAPVYAIEIFDYNRDGNPDFVIAGNQSANCVKIGVIDASYGQLFEGDGKGNFRYITQAVSGLSITGDVKSLKFLTIRGRRYLLAGINNYGIVTYRMNIK